MTQSLLYVFGNDLRTYDLSLFESFLAKNESSSSSNTSAQASLQCLYIFDEKDFKPNRYGLKNIGHARLQFVLESLTNLKSALQSHNVRLHVMVGDRLSIIKNFINTYSVTDTGYSTPLAYDEVNVDKQLKTWIADNNLSCAVHQTHQTTLFTEAELPFTLNELPNSFSKFRKKVEALNLDEIFSLTTTFQNVTLESSLGTHSTAQHLQIADLLPPNAFPETSLAQSLFQGGQDAAKEHCSDYFSQGHAKTYKETRNELEHWTSSTKMSPWLACGCLSPRDLWQRTVDFERLHGANDSTYWIKFELLWREYFQWYSAKFLGKLFTFSGTNDKRPLTSFYPERFKKWATGTTPDQFINAISNQLNQTGYISNRARQIHASYLVHDLGVDWRYGAAYYQQQLIDYDVASNWGNWQYIAGVGCDPRGGRQFNVEKQQNIYDPKGLYLSKWGQKAPSSALDSTDIVDWPIS